MKRILKGTLKLIAALTVTYVFIVTILISLSPRLVPKEDDDDFDVWDMDFEEEDI